METTIEHIKMLNLTDDDFKMIVDGLDALPEKDLPQRMMRDLTRTMIARTPQEANLVMQKSIQEEREGDAKKKLLIENIKILQGKLLMLKRYLQEIDGLKQAYQAINLPKE